ncbi:OPT oligopeptide transporter protein-domain-containing protein [Calycina marina]|uniref:OPT oligopeptide transporter protein-domain-containing protein n=1 Tax=Calycina marina TaxID=1763456 RepID=A0A9P7Z9X6_9HELO|nr:OPT oligopeptide transporter protein-domain-containing protein [Calycina marina]
MAIKYLITSDVEVVARVPEEEGDMLLQRTERTELTPTEALTWNVEGHERNYPEVAFFYLFLSPILYYTNIWYSAYLPFLSLSTFDSTGDIYNIIRVVDKNLNFLVDKYEQYPPMYISMSFSLIFALLFSAVAAVIVHTYLYNGADIWAKFKDPRHGGEDIHKRLMKNKHMDVPNWWSGILTAMVLGLGVFTIGYWVSELPFWGFIVVCFGMACLIVPEGILEGTTNQRT